MLTLALCGISRPQWINQGPFSVFISIATANDRRRNNCSILVNINAVKTKPRIERQILLTPSQNNPHSEQLNLVVTHNLARTQRGHTCIYSIMTCLWDRYAIATLCIRTSVLFYVTPYFHMIRLSFSILMALCLLHWFIDPRTCQTLPHRDRLALAYKSSKLHLRCDTLSPTFVWYLQLFSLYIRCVITYINTLSRILDI